jgi:hypothetical protein
MATKIPATGIPVTPLPCAICRNPLSKRRRKYCSRACYLAGKRERSRPAAGSHRHAYRCETCGKVLRLGRPAINA